MNNKTNRCWVAGQGEGSSAVEPLRDPERGTDRSTGPVCILIQTKHCVLSWYNRWNDSKTTTIRSALRSCDQKRRMLCSESSKFYEKGARFSLAVKTSNYPSVACFRSPSGSHMMLTTRFMMTNSFLSGGGVKQLPTPITNSLRQPKTVTVVIFKIVLSCARSPFIRNNCCWRPRVHLWFIFEW